MAAITLDTGGDVGHLLLIAAIVGTVASVTAELLIARGKGGDTGALELPRVVSAGRKRWWDAGSLAAIPTGIVAACIAGLLLTPVQEVTSAGVTSRTMELDKLVGIAALAGLSSAAFLALVQERFISLNKGKALDAALKSAQASLVEIEKSAGATAGKGDRQEVGRHVRQLLREAADSTPAPVLNALRAHNLVGGEGRVLTVRGGGGGADSIEIAPAWEPDESDAKAEEVVSMLEDGRAAAPALAEQAKQARLAMVAAAGDALEA